MKRIYVVMLAEPDDALTAKLREQYQGQGDLYEISDRTFLVRSEYAARTIRINLGISDEADASTASVVIMRANGDYAGYFSRDIWPWLKGGAI